MVTMETLASSHSNRTVTRELETIPCIAINRDDDIDSSRRMQDENNRLTKEMIELRGTRMQDENSRLRTEITELRERLRLFEQMEQERPSLHSRAGNQWHHHQSYTQHHHYSNEADSSDMSQSTLTDQDLDTIHDENLNGPSTFCKQPSVVSIRSTRQKDVEDATATTTETDEPSSIKITHDVAFETNYKDESFWLMMAERAGWLVGLLLFQSVSSFVLQENQSLLQKYPVIVKFLTMLVGAGGNAGGQACVRVIRCLAVGTLRPDNVKPFLGREMVMGICLTLIMGIAGFLRVYVFDTPLPQAFAITASLLVITMSSVVIGATLPLLMNLCRIDPAHASTTIQVLMDILGVTCTVYVSGAILTSEDDAVGEGY